jgi:hypothetical protein
MIGWEPRQVNGTGLEVRAMSARDMVNFQEMFKDESKSDTEKLVRLAQLCAWKGGARAWTEDEALDQPFPLIKLVSDEALIVNGLGDDPVEQAEGN